MISRELSLSALTRIMSAGGAYAFNVTLARALGKDDYGEFAVGIATILLIAFVTKLGFDSIILRDIAACMSKDDARGASAINSFGMAVTGAFSLPVAIIGVAVASWWLHSPSLAILFLALPAVTWVSMTASIFKAMNRAPTAAFFEVGSASMLALLIFIIYASLSAHAVGLQATCWLFVIASWALVVAGRVIRPAAIVTLLPAEFLQRVDVRKTMCSAIDFTQIGVGQYLSNWAGVLLLGWMVSKGDAAVFSVALRTALLVNFVWQITSAVYSNKIARFHESGDQDEVRTITRTAANTLAALSLPGVLVLLLAPFWLTHVFGAEYGESVVPLQILALGQLVYACGGASVLVIWMTGQEAAGRRIFVHSTVLVVALSVALIPWLGVPGAAAAVSIALTVRTLLAVRLVSWVHKFWPIAAAPY